VISPSSEPQLAQRLREAVPLLDHLHPKMKLDLLLLQCEQGFCPQLVRLVATETGIPTSLMFMRSPGKAFPHHMAAMDGVRTIMK